MGWLVSVHEYSVFRATCNEFGCGWVGPVHDNKYKAEKDVDTHRVWHREKWATLNREWEKT